MKQQKETYLIVVIDDVRIPADPTFEGMEVRLLRTPAAGLEAVRECHRNGEHIDELWLDHDMGLDDEGNDLTIKQVWEWLEEQGHNETPLDVSLILVHTSNAYEAPRMVESLSNYYNVARAELPVKEE